MLILFQFLLVLALVGCGVASWAAYLASCRHRDPSATYVDPFTTAGLTEEGAKLRREYWRLLAIVGGIAVVLVVTIVVRTRI